MQKREERGITNVLSSARGKRAKNPREGEPWSTKRIPGRWGFFEKCTIQQPAALNIKPPASRVIGGNKRIFSFFWQRSTDYEAFFFVKSFLTHIPNWSFAPRSYLSRCRPRTLVFTTFISGLSINFVAPTARRLLRDTRRDLDQGNALAWRPRANPTFSTLSSSSFKCKSGSMSSCLILQRNTIRYSRPYTLVWLLLENKKKKKNLYFLARAQLVYQLKNNPTHFEIHCLSVKCLLEQYLPYGYVETKRKNKFIIQELLSPVFAHTRHTPVNIFFFFFFQRFVE